jgi:NifU-like protein involved in Fe-S cluster formation
VAKFAHEVQACAIGQAAAALVAASVIGSDLVSIEAGMNGFAEYLRGSRSGCDSWPGLSVLALVREYPMRHGAALLAFEAVIEALRKVLDERRRGAVAGGVEQVSARPSV